LIVVGILIFVYRITIGERYAKKGVVAVSIQEEVGEGVRWIRANGTLGNEVAPVGVKTIRRIGGNEPLRSDSVHIALESYP